MRKVGLETLTLRGHSEVKVSRKKHRVTYLSSLYKWNASDGKGKYIAEIQNIRSCGEL